MTTFEVMVIIFLGFIACAFVIMLLVIAWSTFEETQVGEYLVDKLKERKKE